MSESPNTQQSISTNLSPHKPTSTFSWVNSPKFRIYKNVVVLSTAFFLLFASFQAISALQTSINATKGLGSISLSVIYAFFIASCIFLPELLITYLTIKWTIFWSIVMYSTYIAANFKPTWFSLIPTSALLGLAAGPLWTSQSVYITTLGKRLTRITNVAALKGKATTVGSKLNVKRSDILKAQDNTAMVPFLFGIFFAFFQTGTICGQLISSLTLKNDLVVNKKNPINVNNNSTTFSGTSNSRSINSNSSVLCGSNFCSNKIEADSNLFKPSQAKLYTLYSIYLVLALLAALVIALFLDNFSKHSNYENGTGKTDLENDSDFEYDQFTNTPSPAGSERNSVVSNATEKEGVVSATNGVEKNEKVTEALKSSNRTQQPQEKNSIAQMCFATLNQMRRWQQLCLIPLSIYSGLQQGFMSADFTKAYVACNYGVWYLGFVMTVYASVNACISPISGLIGKKVPRWIIFLVSGLVHALGVFPLLTFGSRAISTHFGLMFLVAALFGLFDGIWQPQINGLYSNLFSDNAEPAFANHRLWESIGFIISFSYHDILCIKSKLICLGIFLILSSITYIVLEIRLHRSNSQETNDDTSTNNVANKEQ